MIVSMTMAERQALGHYRGATLPLTQAWGVSLGRVIELNREAPQRFADPAWRQAFIAEVSGWRELLNQLPAEAPSRAQGMHHAIVRWLAAAAAHAATLVAMIHANDREAFLATECVTEEIGAQQQAAIREAQRINDATRAWVNAN